MIRNSKEKAISTKQEGGIGDDKAPTSSRLWSGLRNPRIVRVSRAFGGKDRHSKVSTVRGLRDRRVRLSVPTAIQLYDLQDRLGLNQPSKVVDWLLNAAQREIDKLPPLQMPSGNFMQFPQSSVMANNATPPQSPSNPPSFKNTSYINNNGAYPFALLSSRANNGNMSDVTVAEELPTFPRTTFWNSDASQGTKQRESPKELGIEKGNLMKGNEVEDHDPLLRPGHSSVLSLLSNAYSSNLGLIRHLSQMEAYPTVIPSSLSLAPGSQSMFPSHMITSPDSDARQSSNFQTVASPSQNLPTNPMGTYLHSGCPITRSFYSNLTASKHQHSQGHHES